MPEHLKKKKNAPCSSPLHMPITFQVEVSNNRVLKRSVRTGQEGPLS